MSKAGEIAVSRSLLFSAVISRLIRRRLTCTAMKKHWLNARTGGFCGVRKATPGTEESKEPPKKQPLKEVLQDKADEKKAQKNAPAQTKHKQQDMEL